MAAALLRAGAGSPAVSRAGAVQGSRCIHSVAAQGFQRADSYESGRPGYSDASISAVASSLCLDVAQPRPRPLQLVELGAGTGKFTKDLLRRFPQLAGEYLALEPVEAMRDRFREKCPGVATAAGSAADTGLPDASRDGALAAQAFHWFADMASLREIHRVLRPGASLVLVWNTMDYTIDWVKQLEDIRSQYYTEGTPRFQTNEWRRVFEDDEAKALFSTAPAEWTGVHEQLCDSAAIVDRIISGSAIAMRGEAEIEAVAERVRRVLQEHPDTAPHVASAGRIAMPYTTLVKTVTRLPSE